MYLGIDIGGTKTLVAVFDDKGHIRERVKFLTPQKYRSFIVEIERTVANLSTKQFKYCCVAFPGLINRKEGIGIACGNLPWRNVSIGGDVGVIINAPVVVENDANLAGLSEALALRIYNRVLYVTISTGIGTGIIIDKTISPDFEDSEGGHIILEHNGRRREWEDFASGGAIVRRFGKRAGDIHDYKTWKLIAKNIATGLLDLAVIIRPDIIVIGGGVGTYFERFEKYLTEEMQKFETPLAPIPKLRKAQHPNDAVVIGCYYWSREHERHLK